MKLVVVLSVLSYHRFLLNVFSVCYYQAILCCFFVVCLLVWFSCQYVPRDWLERTL